MVDEKKIKDLEGVLAQRIKQANDANNKIK